ncbi:MAG TPA: ROK family transcriptional regulator [Edaphobacter sp.]
MRLDRHGIRHVDLTQLQLASSETARIINRDIVLELIRTSQPVSRAELARLSGLGRSTVSQIVEQLIDENWVRDGAMGSLPRGRRPTLVGLNGDLVAIAVDIHPGQAIVALVDLNGRLLSRWPVPITSEPTASMRLIIECIQRIPPTAREKSIEGIGISLPGRVNPTTQRLIFAPNLNWPEFDIKKMVETDVGLPVMLENDATACLMAERIFARMDGVRDAVLVAIGEGVGTCVLANGQVVSGHNGMAGEFGHILVDPNGLHCACGMHGCWEIYSSGQAALRYYRELKPKDPVVSFQELLRRAEDGDLAAAQALSKQAMWIGRGLRMIIASVSPSTILIAGELTAAWHRFGPTIEKEAADLTLAGNAPLIRPTHGGEIARLRGAAALVFQRGARRATSTPAKTSAAKSA